MQDAPINSVLRDQAFEAIIEVADQAASYARSIGEAGYRGDQLEVAVHLRQLRECCIAMAKTYNEYLAKANGQDLAETENERRGGQDQRPGDAVA